MNKKLREKIEEIKLAEDFSCWYLVKQETKFVDNCYLVSFLKDYQSLGGPGNLEDYIKKRATQLKAEKGIEVTGTHRALRVASVYGLIAMPTSRFEDANVTDTFKEITDRCKGDYEKMSLYQDIIDRQLEKVYIGSSLDNKKDSTRKDYRLFAVMLLYKVLLELGQTTGNYSIDMLEYKMIVATTKKYEDFLETLYLIKMLREDDQARMELQQYTGKVDNRMNVAIKQLSTITVSSSGIQLNDESIERVREVVYLYEKNGGDLSDEEYLKLLGSTDPIVNVQENTRAKECKGNNILLYGVPGAGKSWTVKHEYTHGSTNVERVVFHPDYTYSDFVGQIFPKVHEDKSVSYEFVPGPFTRILKSAWSDGDNHYWLVVEEINRGNAPAIFGDLFQLLDRDVNGVSEYGITNADIANEVFGDRERKVKLPGNLSIIATMNTSDQNVFTLDTAFQRRWQMRLIDNDFDSCEDTSLMSAEVLDTGIQWKDFAKEINKKIVDANSNNMLSTADKQLGTHFVSKAELSKSDVFAEKVLKYLWDDAVKMNHEQVFDPKYRELRVVVKDFKDYSGSERLEIFNDLVKKAMQEVINNLNDDPMEPAETFDGSDAD